jgi:methyl-accepting chemotaxis protein
MPSPKGSTRRPAKAEAPQAYVSPSLEVLETLEIQNALSNLEARLDSLEIDLARATGSREDDARRIAGEMAVMKARVEDALNAFGGTADELRDMARGFEKRLNDIANVPGDPALREEIKARIDGVTAGVGDVLESMASDVRARMDALGTQMKEIQDGMSSIAERFAGKDRVVTIESKQSEQVGSDDA